MDSKDTSFLVWFNSKDNIELNRENKILFLKEILPIATKFKLNYVIDGNSKYIEKCIDDIKVFKGERILSEAEKEARLSSVKEKIKSGEYVIKVMN